MTENIKLWNQVCVTNPKRTKEFNRGGGFKGTSINPTYNYFRLTEQFGLCGSGWGFDVIKEEYVEGGYISDRDRDIIHVMQINFWYMQGDKKCLIPSKGQTAFVGKNKYGVFTDEEAPKKSLTDAITKAASMLGFGADIFMGMYDDVKYVNDLRATFGKVDAEKLLKQQTPEQKARAAADKIIKAYKDSKSLSDLAEAQERHKATLEALQARYPELDKEVNTVAMQIVEGFNK